MVDQPAPRAPATFTPSPAPIAPAPVVDVAPQPEPVGEYEEPVDAAPPIETMEKPHPLVAALDAHFPDEPGHARTSIYSRARGMFRAIVDEVTGRKS
jgi:hypothetical protein